MINALAQKRAVVIAAIAIVLSTQFDASAQERRLPNPILVFVGQETFVKDKKTLTRYTFDVFNKGEYPNTMFEPAPKLPPCGTNTSAARTWVDIYDQQGKRLNGFCALANPSDLNKIWFSLEENVIPPSWVYIEFVDRQTNTKYKSNLAETTM